MWNTHLARSRDLSPRHGRRQAHLHRPVPRRQPEVPRGRARARAGRPDRHHARARRPRRRHRRRSRRSFGCPVVAHGRAARLARAKGVPEDMPRHRTRAARSTSTGVKVTLTTRNHSSSTHDGTYAGEPAGLVLRLEDGTRVYFAGDTSVFGDMQLIGRLYSPTSPCCRSATTSRWARPRPRSRWSCSARSAACPCHYGTFPPLIGTPEQLARARPGRVELIAPGSPARLDRSS